MDGYATPGFAILTGDLPYQDQKYRGVTREAKVRNGACFWPLKTWRLIQSTTWWLSTGWTNLVVGKIRFRLPCCEAQEMWEISLRVFPQQLGLQTHCYWIHDSGDLFRGGRLWKWKWAGANWTMSAKMDPLLCTRAGFSSGISATYRDEIFQAD